MVLRLGKHEKRLDVKEVRVHWTRLHKANQIRIEHVKEPRDLAAYLSEQRTKRKLAGEFMWQDDLVRWRWSKGWLPQGFTRAFGRVWVRLMALSPGQREKALTDWLHACHVDSSNIINGPYLEDGVVTWPARDLVIADPSPEFDKKITENIKLLNLPDEVRDTPGEEDLIQEDAITRQKWKKKYECRNIQAECADYNAIALRRYLDHIEKVKT